MKFIRILLLFALFFASSSYAQVHVKGKVINSETEDPIVGAVIRERASDLKSVTDSKGEFLILTSKGNSEIIITSPSYTEKVYKVDPNQVDAITIKMSKNLYEIEQIELVTGYQKIPKERVTGSFATVDSKMLNSQVNANLLARITNVASGVLMDAGTSQTAPQFTIRGLSTITGERGALIVVDNFPYEGDLANINPNSIESITILKDAAAASIWGARAANGVVVITTKSARMNQPVRFNLNVNTTISQEPDLSYIKQMRSSDFIDLEKELFTRGFYNSTLTSSARPVISPVVDLLDQVRKGTISQSQAELQINALRNIDSRTDFSRYMYQPSVLNQYSIAATGGYENLAWYTSLGYDASVGNLGEKYGRLNLDFKNRWGIANWLSLSTKVRFTNFQSESGKSDYNAFNMRNGNMVPYMKMADEQGNALAVYSGYNENFKNSFADQLLDWRYYPLTDWQHNKTTNENNEVQLATDLNLKLVKGLDFDVKYQYQLSQVASDQLQDIRGFWARSLVNLYSQINPDGTVVYGIPKGSVFTHGNSKSVHNNLRGQINYQEQFGKHSVSALLGGELKERHTRSTQNRFYGYDTKNLTFGTVSYTEPYPILTGGSVYLSNADGVADLRYRFLSFYGNSAYTFDKRYVLTASARRDASNLFGLKINDQWNPFWSAGFAWNVSNEPFFDYEGLSNLKLRMTYGFNGNIDPSMVAVTTILYTGSNSVYTGTKDARIDNYYNPNLQWETVGVTNLGLDFNSKNSRVSGSIDVFKKKGENMFGPAPVDYTAGESLLTWNVAGIEGKGLDLNLSTLLVDKEFKWRNVLNFSKYRDEITRYHLNSTAGSSFVNASVKMTGMIGKPVYSMFGYKWAGLDPETGDPRGYLDGEISTDYSKIFKTDISELEYFGSAIPTTYGSFLNHFSYKSFSLDVGLTYKLGYWFRRSSIHYTNLFNNWTGHSDYANRWQKPGDELNSNVPSNQYKTNSSRDQYYERSSVLIEKGDHVRLQYVNLVYQFPKSIVDHASLKNLEIRLNVSNLGLLWKANKAGIDPDYNLGKNRVVDPMTFTLGINTKF